MNTQDITITSSSPISPVSLDFFSEFRWRSNAVKNLIERQSHRAKGQYAHTERNLLWEHWIGACFLWQGIINIFLLNTLPEATALDFAETVCQDLETASPHLPNILRNSTDIKDVRIETRVGEISFDAKKQEFIIDIAIIAIQSDVTVDHLSELNNKISDARIALLRLNNLFEDLS